MEWYRRRQSTESITSLPPYTPTEYFRVVGRLCSLDFFPVRTAHARLRPRKVCRRASNNKNITIVYTRYSESCCCGRNVRTWMLMCFYLRHIIVSIPCYLLFSNLIFHVLIRQNQSTTQSIVFTNGMPAAVVYTAKYLCRTFQFRIFQPRIFDCAAISCPAFSFAP